MGSIIEANKAGISARRFRSPADSVREDATDILHATMVSLGDPAMEDMLYDSASMKRFVGISIDEVPDETTLCKFRHFLEKPQANGVPILIIAVILGRTRLAITRRDDSGCEHHRSPELNKE